MKSLIKLIFFLLILNGENPLFAGAHFYESLTNGQYVLRRWNVPHAKWRYQVEGAPANAQALIEQAFDTWQNANTAIATHEFSGTTAKDIPEVDGFSDIFFNISPADIQLPAGIIAITLRNSTNDSIFNTLESKNDAIITEADIILNSDLTFVVEPSDDPTSLDLVEVLSHEIGHLYGLAHSFQIDSMMYPAKPDASTQTQEPELVALFRAPKRTLSQDDRAFLSMLYPSDDFESATGQIYGQVFYEGEPYVGAHVVALKQGESDLDLVPLRFNSGIEFIVKGLKNVSIFSGENGEFELKGLEPGTYSIFVQNSDPFLSFTLSNVSDFLGTEGSFLNFPSQFWTNPDCRNLSLVTETTAAQLLESAEQVEIQAGDALCQLELEAHSGGTTCGAEAGILKNSCSRKSGFCSLEPRMTVLAYFESNPGIFLIILGSFIFLLSARGRGRRNTK